MTIEVRQLLIRSSVDEPGSPGPAWTERGPLDAEREVIDEAWAQQFRREVLAECKHWFDRRLAEHAER